MSNELGRWIERERKKRGWSQRRLAQEAGISQAPISRIINKTPQSKDEQICGEKVAKALAEAFGANPIYAFRLARVLKPPPRSRNFSTWLVGELLLRKMSQEELSERAGLDPEVIADLTRGIPPTFEISEKLAFALDLEPSQVQQVAGLLPPGEQTQVFKDEEIEMINDLRTLGEASQRIVYDLVRSLKDNLGHSDPEPDTDTDSD